MDLQTISQVSRDFGVSTRTLRYYEQIGLITSVRTDDYAYRAYDDATVLRLRQIVALKKLNIPLKQIQAILKGQDAQLALNIFNDRIKETEVQIACLSSVRNALMHLRDQLGNDGCTFITSALFCEESIKAALPETKGQLKECASMSEMNVKSDTSKLTDVRILYLPPATVLASHFVGENPEEESAKRLDRFVLESGLCRIKPDLRQYGFNHPNPSPTAPYGYERWITIPDDFEVPAQFTKKRFKGGMYAAHMIPMDAFEEWSLLAQWVDQNEKYKANYGAEDCMGGCLEEHLNYVNYVRRPAGEPYDLQLDLMIPIIER